ncbi:MAG: Alkaline phosphatase synthesis transcriptional regulatory protein PhoP [Alphaproteobacteria bacterium MarineAlpha10_Bin3]|jgi:phosphoribosyl 1,2-cyclic phosphodiesterase/CheY-like chemotaxis protein|nr:MAG: Alkaline phosphatase synthesis transcriptional regulatory protein PhoP [Alphaproteobacteria bacterium MarineAlpha10_Bin3]PPR74972.1 MAG: Alkaline phosphatase synthesis transcriptional regulatory protein PhoP [Alphaproteobacteria bacterium MarineAlpha4_Bin1]
MGNPVMTDTKERKFKFVIIDDDQDIIDLETALLAKEGHEVISLIKSDNALQVIQQEQPDCVLSDIMMPDIDGMMLLKQIRDDKSLDDIKVVLVTGRSFAFDRRQAMKLGADGFIGKPLDIATFAETVIEIIVDEIEMTFWGVRGTLPVPGPKTLKYGGNTSCMTLQFAKGQFFVFDAGTGIKALSNHLMATRDGKLNAKIFISHPHWDHINALPYFAPLYIPGNEFEILGAAHASISLRDLISSQMDDVYFPITMKDFGSHVEFRELGQGAFDVDGIAVKTMLLSHPGNCLGYRIDYKGRSICYITDNELFLPESPSYYPNYGNNLASFIEGSDALITDCTYSDAEYASKVGWGHSCISRVVALAHRANIRVLYLAHHDPDQDDDAIDGKFESAKKYMRDLNSSTDVLAPAESLTVFI